MAGTDSWMDLQVWKNRKLNRKSILISFTNVFSILSSFHWYYGRTIAFFSTCSVTYASCKFSKCEKNISRFSIHTLLWFQILIYGHVASVVSNSKIDKIEFLFWNHWSVPKRIQRITILKRFSLNKEFIKNEKMSAHIKFWPGNMIEPDFLSKYIKRKSMNYVTYIVVYFMPFKESICVFKALINKIIKNCKCYLDYIDGIQVYFANVNCTQRLAVLFRTFSMMITIYQHVAS